MTGISFGSDKKLTKKGIIITWIIAIAIFFMLFLGVVGFLHTYVFLFFVCLGVASYIIAMVAYGLHK
jgi:hypothetical protein